MINVIKYDIVNDMKVEIVKLDNLGRGIGYIDNKIIFIPKSVPGDILEIEITNDKKNYMEGKITKIINSSKNRREAICPYFNICGGCDLMHLSLSDMLEYKLKETNEILKFNKINYEVKDIIKSTKQYNYRNKISLKIINRIIGYYEYNTHNIIDIDDCYLVNEPINNIIKDISINNGNITIRCNYNNEVMLIIDSEDNLENIDELIDKHKIIGIIKNNECVYGNDYYFDKITNFTFKISHDAFFQINPFICSKLFELIEINTKNSSSILDLYCGVGTLSIVSSQNAKKVVGVEIVENAINDAKFNAKLNNITNCEFICADTKNILDKITTMFDTIILDPPRSGVNKNVLNKIIDESIKKIIYISCNPLTLVRDLKILEESYEIKEYILLDMFVNTHHVESFVILEKR